MKKASLLLISVITIHVSGWAQSDHSVRTSVIINNPGSTDAFADKDRKKLDFFVEGLEADQVQTFAERVRNYDGVSHFTISEEVTGGKRSAHIEFADTYADNYFQKLLIYSGVYKTVINGKEQLVRGGSR
jgi:hypothetical protein